MLGLSFLYPAFLLAAAAIGIPIVLHLLKREAAPPLPFSAVRFLRRAPVEQTRRKRLRELLLLALRVAALLLLALAFARPYVSGGPAAASAPVTVVAVDTSYSLSAPGQFDRAREFARQAVRSAPSDHLVALLSFNDAVDVVVEPTGNRGLALAAIDGLEAGFGATRYRSALARAADVIGARGGRVIVVSDLQRAGWDARDEGSIPERIAVEVAAVAPPGGNLAVGAIRREGVDTLVTILQSGQLPPTTRVTLAVDGRPVGTQAATLGEGASGDVRFAVTLPDRGTAAAMVEDEIGYQADNNRYLILDPPPPASLLLIGETGRAADDAFYVEQALSAGDDVNRFALTTVSTDAVAGLGPATLRPYGAVLLLSTRKLERRAWENLGSYLQGGGGLLVPVDGQVDGAVVGEILGPEAALRVDAPGDEAVRLSFAPVDLRHPIFRPFGVFAGNLGQVRFERTRQITVEAGGSAQVIARFSDASPALVEQRIGEGRALLFASDLSNRWNDFPLHPGFVPFMHETVRHLVRNRAPRSELLVAEAPAGMPAVPGIARVDDDRRVAVNVDAREASVLSLSAEEFQGQISRLNREAAVESQSDATLLENEQSYWRYGLMVMLLALAVESLLGTRVG